MKRFYLQRNIDETGISGTGKVTQGFEIYKNGPVVMYWDTEVYSGSFYKNVNDVVKIHGHNGKTELVWIDEEENPEGLIEFAKDFFRKWSS